MGWAYDTLSSSNRDLLISYRRGVATSKPTGLRWKIVQPLSNGGNFGTSTTLF